MAAITAGGLCLFFSFLTFYFAFFVCISIPHPFTPISSFFFSPLPNSPQRTQQPCLQDPVLPSLLLPSQDWEDSAACPRAGPLGSWEDFDF